MLQCYVLVTRYESENVLQPQRGISFGCAGRKPTHFQISRQKQRCARALASQWEKAKISCFDDGAVMSVQ
jgi:hypothetical protein